MDIWVASKHVSWYWSGRSVPSPLMLLILVPRVSFFFFFSVYKGLSVSLVFSKNQLLVLLIFLSFFYSLFCCSPSWSVPVVANGRICSFSWLNNNLLYVWSRTSLFIHVVTGTQVVSSTWLLNNAAMTVEAHTSFWVRFFVSFGCIPRSGIAGSGGGSVCTFSRILRAVLW